MNVHYQRDQDFEERVDHMLQASSLFAEDIEKTVARIVRQVRKDGDQALIQLTRKYDGAALTAAGLPVATTELRTARRSRPQISKTIREVTENIRTFSRASQRRNWQIKNHHGAVVGEKYDPLHRVGIYIPGGTAPLISTALMTVVLANVAGCPEIVACTPCNAEGQVDAHLLHALDYAGATEIYRIGGAQAIAAMAYGTETIRPADKLFGPGNAYVVAAKRLVFGQAAIDLLPGPSEVLIVADETARPEWVAADLLAQAEHGSGHERAVLLTTSERLLQNTLEAVQTQMPQRSRAAQIQAALSRNGWGLHVTDLATAIDIANRFAPEHCQLMTRRPQEVARKIRTAGALLLGHHTPTVLGDYVAGPSHVLPTGGAGHGFSGLTVDQFQRRTSVLKYQASSLKKAWPSLSALAELEGLDAHARSAAVRLV